MRSLGRAFVRSYKCFAPRDTGKSTKRPTASNDTGTQDGPHRTGTWPEGSVWGGEAWEKRFAVGNAAPVRDVDPEQAHPPEAHLPHGDSVDPPHARTTKGKTHT